MNRILLILGFLLWLTACGGDSPPSEEASSGGSSTEATAGSELSVAGLRFTAPSAWQALGPSRMRQQQYRYGPMPGDREPAEVNVFYFGPDQGGGIDANLQRWVGQMSAPDGGSAQPLAIRSKLDTGEVEIHFVEVDGIFNRSLGGGPMTGGKTEPMEGFRLVGAVVAGPQGNVFFKLVGPAKTAKAMEDDFRQMLRSVELS